ncbi:FecCD family ABC transporter permease [Methylocella sp.]|uniref:FecCD family ABC transporter permease n=1 Tax=Methylocella sp. TaxID=1978226 RepID=UPI003785150F
MTTQDHAAPSSARATAGAGLFAAALVLLVALAMALALTLGRYPIGLFDIGRLLLYGVGAGPRPDDFDILANVVIEIRLPRVLSAALVGAALSVSGAAYQAAFRNPLVSPDILGVLSGAAFGAVAALMLGAGWLVMQIAGFCGGVAAALVGVGVASLFGEASIIMLVLGGLVSGALFTALLTVLKYVADPYNQLPAIVYWLMGGLGAADLAQLRAAGPPIVAGLVALMALGRALDALSMGDDEARALGVPVERLRLGVVAAATLVSSLAVSLAGMIGWIGLFIPHLARLVVGPANARLVPASAAFGAVFLIGADAVSRSAAAVEIPIGVLTELLGIPAFILALSRARRSWAA